MALSKSVARRLVNEAKAAFGTLEKFLPKIIEGEAWVALGYADVYEFWKAEFGEYRLATEVARVELVYAMFRAGKADVETAVAVKGVGGETVKARRRQFNSGLSVEQAEAAGTKVTSFYRTDTQPKTRCIRVTVSNEEWAEFAKLATAQGSSVEKLAGEAVRAHFAALRPTRRRKAA